eukprot:1727593-Pleurochrysis_carterae.AAC.3
MATMLHFYDVLTVSPVFCLSSTAHSHSTDCESAQHRPASRSHCLEATPFACRNLAYLADRTSAQHNIVRSRPDEYTRLLPILTKHVQIVEAGTMSPARARRTPLARRISFAMIDVVAAWCVLVWMQAVFVRAEADLCVMNSGNPAVARRIFGRSLNCVET